MGLAEIREFTLAKLPVAVRFGLGSAEAVKRWSRFTIRKNGDLYWVSALYIRPDVDKINKHLSIHKDGRIFTSLHQNGQRIASSPHGNLGCSLTKIAKPYHVTSGEEFFEPGYLYYGLISVCDNVKRETPNRFFIACLDENLVNSRLRYSFDLLPLTKCEQVINYVTKLKTSFNLDDQRSHVYIFYYGEASIAVTMKFTEGDEPIDIEKVRESDQRPQSLKRLYF